MDVTLKVPKRTLILVLCPARLVFSVRQGGGGDGAKRRTARLFFGVATAFAAASALHHNEAGNLNKKQL